MDCDLLRNSSQQLRYKALKEELPDEKIKIIDWYDLESNTNPYWEKRQNSYPAQEFFGHKFVKKTSPLGMIFHIYRLCYAKVKYFEKNWDKFISCQYNWNTQTFEECQMFEMECIKHLSTGMVFDLRNLSKINRIEDFLALCKYLEDRE
jgi:hypothetical protein